MEINRRIFLGSMLYVVSASVLPSELKKSLNLTVFKSDAAFFEADQFTLLYDIADIMIPRTDTPGSMDTHAIQVLDELMISWAAPSTQQQFNQFLSEFLVRAKSTFNTSYFLLGREKRQSFLELIDERAFDKDKSDFAIAYKRLKALIFHIHYSSETANPNFFLVPGGYRGSLTQDELNVIYERKYL
ncbi:MULTISPECIES: gluconate 2-dehydrogenase subunit 3 family protein [unclassified Alteromonas]|uniref:gluconate 2-dehydrogenase subunit 3 family protein n=1 Tax=unclassified Alteromonas TaxID=2614992 RepID=UPI000509FC33|nr:MULTISPECIES: gluconate 2-dehydrogenase subunit 3 family protein [unclassified Alteromonas]